MLPPYSFIAPTTPIPTYKWDYSTAQANATAEKSFAAHKSSSGLSGGAKAAIAVSAQKITMRIERVSTEG